MAQRCRVQMHQKKPEAERKRVRVDSKPQAAVLNPPRRRPQRRRQAGWNQLLARPVT